MSRSGYSDECGHLALWRGAVDRATFGARGQRLLKRLRDALDQMPAKRLIAGTFSDAQGGVCALGAIDPSASLDFDDEDSLKKAASHFGIAPALAAEIMFVNDEAAFRVETPEQRWSRMRGWVDQQIGPED